jgi:hypothetical protein
MGRACRRSQHGKPAVSPSSVGAPERTRAIEALTRRDVAGSVFAGSGEQRCLLVVRGDGDDDAGRRGRRCGHDGGGVEGEIRAGSMTTSLIFHADDRAADSAWMTVLPTPGSDAHCFWRPGRSLARCQVPGPRRARQIRNQQCRDIPHVLLAPMFCSAKAQTRMLRGCDGSFCLSLPAADGMHAAPRSSSRFTEKGVSSRGMIANMNDTDDDMYGCGPAVHPAQLEIPARDGTYRRGKQERAPNVNLAFPLSACAPIFAACPQRPTDKSKCIAEEC